MSSNLASFSANKKVIQASELGKCFRIYDNPKDRLKQAILRGHRQYYREFWALKNISFEVKRGESLGIIGRNGSGKSTLLQLICGTLNSTEGRLTIQGRIAALLELGSGFNPEFTGLENVYLNASLLGLKKEETEKELEKILAFADIGEFINQPVKTYSSGMSVRLAFAVIAHVNADILVVDEALAVGDAVFVQRCMRFIRRIREERCLLFVSHDDETVKSLCSHALWLSKGKLRGYGECKAVTLDYMRYCQAETYGEQVTVEAIGKACPNENNLEEKETEIPSQQLRTSTEAAKNGDFLTQVDNLANAKGWKTGVAEIVHVSIKATKSPSDNKNALIGGEEVEITIRATSQSMLRGPIIGFVVKDKLGQSLFGANTLAAENSLVEYAMPGQEITGIFRLSLPILTSGIYALTAGIAEGDSESYISHHWAEEAVIINIRGNDMAYGIVGAAISKVELRLDRK